MRYDVSVLVSRSVTLQLNMRSHGVLLLELLRWVGDCEVFSDGRRLVDDSSSVSDGEYSLEKAISVKDPLARFRDVCVSSFIFGRVQVCQVYCQGSLDERPVARLASRLWV